MSRNKILDTSSILIYLSGGEGVNLMADLLNEEESKSELFISYITLAEIYEIMKDQIGEEKSNQILGMIKNWGVKFVPANEVISLAAARIKSNFPIPYADAFATATAQMLNAELISGNPKLENVKHLVPITWVNSKEEKDN